MISQVTEISDSKEKRQPLRGWVFYDGQCRRCTAAARLSGAMFHRRGYRFVPLQTGWVQKRLGLTPGAPVEEMRILTTHGEEFGGAEAVIFLARQIWWASPLAGIAKIPGAHRLLDRAYRWIAAKRSCKHLNCELSSRAAKLPQFKERRSRGGPLRCGSARGRPPLEFRANASIHGGFPAAKQSLMGRTGDHRSLISAILPPVALLGVAAIIGPHIARWAFMSAMVAAVFFACKWLTFWRAKPRLGKVSPRRILVYFLLWPGLDAPGFLGLRRIALGRAEAVKILLFALFKTAFGAALLIGVARLSPHLLLAGWIGMAGLVLLLHFGLFDITATLWRMRGVNAAPIMNRPIAARSLSDFWGRRWNAAFNQLIFVLFFRNFARRFGTVRAVLTAFLISGLLHELVISLPAGGGYGLPTGYFLLQGWAVLAQRLPVAARLHLRHGLRGWMFTMFFTAAPAFWLFHPLFIRQVMLPFMQAIGAL